MNYTFLLIDLILLLIPFCLLLARQSFTLKFLASAIIPAFVSTIIYTEMAIFWAGLKVISFNKTYLLGGFYRLLPVEFYLFIFAFSFAGLSIYHFLNLRFPQDTLQKYSLAVSHVVMGICIAFLFFAYTKWFSVIIFAFLFLLLFFVEYKNQLRFMYRFYRAFAVCLLPFLGCFAWLANLPIVNFTTVETADLLVYNVPFESVFMLMGMLLLTVYVFEFIRSRTLK